MAYEEGTVSFHVTVTKSPRGTNNFWKKRFNMPEEWPRVVWPSVGRQDVTAA